MSKAQVVGQVFIYVLSIILVAVVLLYGYKAVSDFREKSAQVSLIKLRTDLSSSIDSLTSDYGSVRIKELALEGYSGICFLESYEQPSLGGLRADPLIMDSVSSQTGRNVFLMRDTVDASFEMGSIAVEPDLLCVPARNGEASIRLEGKGDHVVISPQQG